jgi:hypothetical protein
MASDEGPGLEGTKAGMFRKTKEISEYDQSIEDWENPDDDLPGREGCGFRRAKDECGTMNDELKKAGSQNKK